MATVTVQPQLTKSNPGETVEVQRCSIPVSGGYEQITTTHYPAQVEPRTISGSVQQGSSTLNQSQIGYVQSPVQGEYHLPMGFVSSMQGGPVIGSATSTQALGSTCTLGPNSQTFGSTCTFGSYSEAVGSIYTRASQSPSMINQQHRFIPGSTTTSSYPVGQSISTGMYNGEQSSTSRFVTAGEHVVGYNVIAGEERIISEKIIEHEIKVPKKVIREEVIEKVIVIPETITREEIIEETQRIKETIIEVAKPIIQEKIVEVVETEYRDKIVEKVEKIFQEKIREVPKIEYQERIIEVPKIITRDSFVEVPEIEYRDVTVEKIVEVPQIHEQVVVKEVPIPQYVEKAVPEYVTVETPFDVDRNIPIPVESVNTFEYQLAQFRPRVHKVKYPLYVPRFVEVPVSAELFDAPMSAQLQAQSSRLQTLASGQAVGLCEIEHMATEFRRTDFASLPASNMDLQNALINAWKSKRIGVTVIPQGPTTSRSIATTQA